MRTYKEWAYATKGITQPELIMALSGHPSFNKACEYFGVKLVVIDLDPVTLQMDLNKMEDAINSHTIGLVASACGWPHGVVDPVPEMGQIALKYGIGLHVDSCLGGFVIAFHKKYF